MAKTQVIQKYAPCPRCEWPRAAWWSDGWIDCEDCGIYALADSELREIEDGEKEAAAK